MIIDKEQLISLLEEKTGLDRARVEDQLEELIKRIQKAAAKDKSFEIEGFGTFSMEEDQLQFEPSDTLGTEINNKYAGMKPIELIGAFKEPEGDEVPEIEEDLGEPKDKVWAFDKEADEQGEMPEEVVDEEYSEEAEEQEEPVTADDKEQEAVERQHKMEEKSPSGQRAETPEKEETEDQEEKDYIGKFLVAAVIIIAIGLSGWVVYDTGLVSGWNSAERGEQSAEISTQQRLNSEGESATAEESSPGSSEESRTSEPGQNLAVEEKEDPQPEEPSMEEDTFGLKGTVNESISDGYTIVVYSLRSKEVAEDRRKNFEEAGYRALISKAEVQGTTYFRIGLGQFPTVEAAQQAVSDLPESYQSNQDHFIKRFQ